MTPWVIWTISTGMSSRLRICAELSRKPHSRQPTAIPTGLFRPSSAMAMPVKPRPAGKSSE